MTTGCVTYLFIDFHWPKYADFAEPNSRDSSNGFKISAFRIIIANRPWQCG